MLIGFGAKLAGGCTSGNGLSGTAMLSPAALSATATFFATAIIVTFITKALTMSSRLTGLGIGLVFGVVLSWSGMTSPVVIRQALLFQQAYLFLFFASAVLVAGSGLWLLRRRRTRALVTRQPIAWPRESPGRSHIVGSVIFGIGWGISDACPGPIATQVGQGIPYALFTITGVVGGVWLYHRREARAGAVDVEAAPQPAESRQVYAGS